MSELFYVASSEILGIKSNTQHFKWAFGTRMPKTDRAAYDECKVRVCFTVGLPQHMSKIERAGENGVRDRYHHFSAKRGDDALIYERPFLFGKRLYVRVEGLLRNELDITVSEAYHRFVIDKFLNVYSDGYILTDLASVLLLNQGYAPLHCAAIKKGGATVVLCGPSSSGKTLTATTICESREVGLITEDLALTDGISVYSVPWTSTYRQGTPVKQSWPSKTIQGLSGIISAFRPHANSTHRLENERVAAGNMLDSADITHLIILEQGLPSVTRGSNAECFRRIANLNSYQFNYRTAPVLTAYEYFNPALDIEAVRGLELSILSKLVDNAEERFIISATDVSMFANMVSDILERDC